MPRKLNHILAIIASHVNKAARNLKSFGCHTGSPRPVEILIEAYGLYDSLTQSEKKDFYDRHHLICQVVTDKTIQIEQVERLITVSGEWEKELWKSEEGAAR